MKSLVYKLLLLLIDFIFLSIVFYYSKKLLGIYPTIKSFSFLTLVTLGGFYYEKIYDIRYDFWHETKRIYKILSITYIMIFLLALLTKPIVYFEFLSLFFGTNVVFFPIYRRLLKRILFSFDFFKENVKIIGEKKVFKKEIQNDWYLGMKESENFDSLIIISKSFDVEELDKTVEKYVYDKKIYLVPFLEEINFASSKIIEFYNIRLNTIKIENKLLERKNIIAKKIFDLIFTVIVTPVFLIIHPFIVILIKFDSKGSVFFKQKRIGKDGKIFLCYKYRTMIENGDNILKEYLKAHPDEIEYFEKYHKYKNDPRITRIGKFLRSTSLDELPQVINVLKGEMSFIGPRPYLPYEIKKIDKYKDFIFKVKPGITGLWQVSGRNNLTFNERVRLEKWYIKNWSLWLDFVILVKTLKVVSYKTGAM